MALHMDTSRRILPLAALLLAAAPTLSAQQSTSYIVAAPWGQLVTGTETSLAAASPGLHESARRFERLFGDRPAMIRLVVEDSSADLAVQVRFAAASTWV